MVWEGGERGARGNLLHLIALCRIVRIPADSAFHAGVVLETGLDITVVESVSFLVHDKVGLSSSDCFDSYHTRVGQIMSPCLKIVGLLGVHHI